MKVQLVIALCFAIIAGVLSQSREISFGEPALDDEQEWSPHIPTSMSCESCKAIAVQLSSAIWKLHQQLHPKSRIKSESVILDAFEKLCTTDKFEEYGAKSVGGITKLSGPGLAANDAPGMLMAGGIWAGRLAHRCTELVGEADEYMVYLQTVKNKGDVEALYNQLCNVEEHSKLNSCTGGRAAALDPVDWRKGEGSSWQYDDDAAPFGDL